MIIKQVVWFNKKHKQNPNKTNKKKQPTTDPFQSFIKYDFADADRNERQARYEYTYPLLNLSVIMKTHILSYWHKERCRLAELTVWLYHPVCATSPSFFVPHSSQQICSIQSWCKNSGCDCGFVPTDSLSSCERHLFLTTDFEFLVFCLTYTTMRKVHSLCWRICLRKHPSTKLTWK